MGAEINKPWISATSAGAILGLTKVTFRKMVAETRSVAVRQYPGMQPRFSRADVERLARECITEAAR